MRKNYILIFLMAVSLGLLFSSCVSKPPVEETPPPVQSSQSADQASLNALNDAAAQAEAARKQAADFDGQSYFPSDWETVESQYTAAKNLPRANNDEAQKAISAYNDAAAGFNGLFEKSIPLYAQAREDEVMAARDELLASGLAWDFPDYLEAADDIALKALEQYKAKDYNTAKDTAGTALATYQTLTSGANAYLARDEIITRRFYPFGPGNFEKAEEAGIAAISAYDEGNLASARDNADEALLRYNLVLNEGWASHVAELKTTVATERQKALDHKANIAVRADFEKADALYRQAVASLEAEEFRVAARQYIESENLFIAAGKTAEVKRLMAEDDIKEAEERAQASDEAARKAEIILEGDSL
jgi:hypothetical protein